MPLDGFAIYTLKNCVARVDRGSGDRCHEFRATAALLAGLNGGRRCGRHVASRTFSFLANDRKIETDIGTCGVTVARIRMR